MSPAITIYGQTYTHKGRAFQVWSYLDDPDPKRSTLRFAFRVEGVTVQGLSDRAEAIRKARQRIDELPAKSVEETPAADPPQASQDQHQQRQDLSRLDDNAEAPVQPRDEAQSRPAQLNLLYHRSSHRPPLATVAVFALKPSSALMATARAEKKPIAETRPADKVTVTTVIE